jgi:uncharacterized protein (DUF362 family)
VVGAWRYLGFLVWRNRFAIAIASLVWLIWRSGTQPRRLTYPCQQAAAANLGFLAVLLIPEAARRHAARRKPGRRAFALATGSVALAGALSLLISAGVAVYSQWVLSSMAANIPPPTNPPPPTSVAITRTSLSTLTNADVEALVRKAVADAGGLQGIVQPGDHVSIKPNLVNDNNWSASSPTGVTTDPRVVAAVVKMAKEAGATAVRIVEGTAGPFDWSGQNGGNLGRNITWDAFRKCGYDVNGDNYFDYDNMVTLVDLNDAGTDDLVPRPVTSTPPNTVLVTLPNGVIRTQYYVPKVIATREQGGICDVLISVPTLKNHSNGGVTLAMKNRVGCAPSDIYHVTTYIPEHSNQMKWDLVHWAVTGGPCPGTPPFPRNVSHSNPAAPSGTPQVIENTTVNYTIVDLNLVRPNDFAVVDGLVGITNGPTGTTKASPYMKLIMAGKDSVAVDTVGTLLMGYDPLESLQIGWAWNRELGTRDTSIITVVGDHVQGIRDHYVTGTRQFPCGYGDAACVETNPPTITDVQPPNGSQVFGDVVVTGSGISDDTGVTKAELSVRLTAGPNLLANGDFEQGAANWTTWQAPDWGDGETWNFANTEAGHLGNQCLHLSSGKASFGVYQEVAVEPGKTYKIDAYWKGRQLGPNGDHNWYEVLILDGPWNYGQADGNPNDPPFNNPSQPVFNEMYGYDSHTYSMTGDFGWEWTHDLNDTLIDTMNRDGLRTATGNVMTVVLKAGACCDNTGSSGWFDNISLAEVGDEHLVDSLPYPPDPFNLVWASNDYLSGDYDLKVTVYDAALNEASITRSVIKTNIPKPIIAVDPTSLNDTADLSDPPPDSLLTIWNSGIGILRYRVTVDQTWISVSPETGDSQGEPDQFTVHYDLAGMGVGTYHANITITDDGSTLDDGTPMPAHNSPVVVPVTLNLRSVKPDIDGDCDVDQEDWGTMQACLSGELMPIAPGCEKFDFQKDLDVDWVDVGFFQQCFGGPGVCAPAACDDNYP